MAVRQYIGARYVPLYAGRWDSRKNYEPLMIVDDANGNSYTSMRDVPAGTPLSDTTYWIQTSSFSGAITQLQQRMGTAEANINRIDSELDHLSDRFFILIGDSYSWGHSQDQRGWAVRFIDENGLVEDENVIIGAKLMSGSGERRFTPGSDRSFSNQLIYAKNLVPAGKTVTDIIVLGGTNDKEFTITQIETGIRDFMEKSKSFFPGASVKVGVLMGSSFKTAERSGWLRKIVEAYSLAGKYGAAYILNSEFIAARSSYFGSDGFHPVTAGYDAMQKYINSLFNANAVDVFYQEGVATSLDVTDAEVTGQREAFKVTLHNDSIQVEQYSNTYFQYLQLKTPESVTSGNMFNVQKKIGTLNSDLFCGNATSAEGMFKNTVAYAVDSNGNTYMGVAKFFFKDGGDLYIGGTFRGAGTLSITHIIAPLFELTLPTLQACY